MNRRKKQSSFISFEKQFLVFSMPLVLLAIVSFPVMVSAAGNFDFLNGLVPCATTASGNKMCTVCDFFKLVQNIMNFFLFVTAPLVTLVAIYIAYILMFSGGSPQKINDAKGRIWLTLLGIFWVVGSWLVINTALNLLVDKNTFPWPWNQINCEVSATPSSSGNQGSFNALPDTQAQFGAGEVGVRDRLAQAGIPIPKGACPTGTSYQNVSGGCTSVGNLQNSTVDKLIALKQTCNCALTVTGGSELGHAVGTASHGTGDKVDLRLSPDLNSYIANNLTYIGQRADTAGQYRAADGSIFVKEGDHWDITFTR